MQHALASENFIHFVLNHTGSVQYQTSSALVRLGPTKALLYSSCSQSFQVRDSEYLKEFSPAGLVSPEISEWLALPQTADTGRRERHATATTTHPTRPTARPSRASHVSRAHTSHQRPSRHRTWRAAPRSARQLDSRSLAGFEQAGGRYCAIVLQECQDAYCLI